MLSIIGNGMGGYDFSNITQDLTKFDKIICDKNFTQEGKNILKLSYKEKDSYDKLPDMIESLESKIEQLKECLYDPSCYEDKGLVTLSEELKVEQVRLEEMVEEYLILEEKVEMIERI